MMKYDWSYYKTLFALVLVSGGAILLLEHIARYGMTELDVFGHETYGVVMIVAGFLLVLKRRKKDE